MEQLYADDYRNPYSKRAWLVTLTASLFFFYTFIQLNVFNSINDDLMRDFHIQAVELGHLASMFFYANALFLIPAGILLDRYSTHVLLIIATIFSTLGTYIFAVATDFSIASIGRFIVGISAAFCFISSVRIASRWFPPNRMALVTGIIVTMAMLGGLVAQTPFTILKHAIGWRHAMLVDVGLGVAILLAIIVIVRDRPPHIDKHAEHAELKRLGFWKSLSLVFKNPNNWYGGIYTSLLNFPVFLLGALWGIHYLVEAHNLTNVQASVATTIFFLGVILGSPAFGWFSDHIGKRIMPMVVGAILSFMVMMILILVHNLSFPALIIIFFLIGFVTSSQVLSYPTIAELNPPALTGTALSIASTTIMLSGALIAPVFGWLLELTWNGSMHNAIPDYSAADFRHALMIMPVSFILGLVIALLIRETNCELKA